MSQEPEPNQTGKVLLWCLVCWAFLAIWGIAWELQSMSENQCRFPPSIDLPKDSAE